MLVKIQDVVDSSPQLSEVQGLTVVVVVPEMVVVVVEDLVVVVVGLVEVVVVNPGKVVVVVN